MKKIMKRLTIFCFLLLVWQQSNGSPCLPILNPFTELPQIAVYLNEIKQQQREHPAEDDDISEPLELTIEHGELVLTEAGFEMDPFYDEEKNSLYVHRGWSGTSVIDSWEDYAQLLVSGKEPIVVLVESYEHESRSYSSVMELAGDYAEELMEKYPKMSEEKIYDIARKEKIREWEMEGVIQNYGTDYYKFKISVYQKKNGHWEDISSQKLPEDFNKKIEQHSPNLFKKGNTFNRCEFTNISEAFASINETIYQDWHPMTLEIGKKKIYIAGSEDKNAPIVLAWNGEKYVFEKLPDANYAYNYNTCNRIDFKSDKMYTFKGSVDGLEIQMEVKFKQLNDNENPTIKMTGSYFYEGKSSKMPIEGEFTTELGKAIVFYRTKDGKQRESFQAHFSNCKFSGYWQHLERLDINQFDLMLVE